MGKNTLRLLVGALTSCCLLLTGCAGGGRASKTDAILPMPPVDDTSGLVIAGERVADPALLAAARENTVRWFTSSGSDTVEPLAARFEAETGVDIDVRRLGSSKLNERVLSEAGVGRLTSDVITTGDPTSAEEFARRGILVPYTGMPVHDQLARTKNTVWSNGAYYTAYYTASGIVCNSRAVTAAEAPKSWNDLLDPRWRGRLGVIEAGAGGPAQGLAAFQEDVLGPDYWAKLATQQPRVFDVNAVELEALARGELSCGSAVLHTVNAAQRAGAPVAFVAPTEGVAGTFNMQGITSTGADNPAARLFMNWTLSKSGQQFAMAQGFVGSRTDVEPVATGAYRLPRANDPTFVPYDPEKAKREGAGVVRRWSQVLR